MEGKVIGGIRQAAVDSVAGFCKRSEVFPLSEDLSCLGGVMVKRHGEESAPPLQEVVEARLANAAPTELSADQLRHELQRLQIELETQNEELRRAQQALEESRDRYLDLYLFAPISYLTLTGTGLIVDANITAATHLGLERKELLQRQFDSFLAPEYEEHWRRQFLDRIKHESKVAIDLALNRIDGTISHVHAVGWCLAPKGKAPLIRITLIDINEHTQAEKALRESEERYRTLFTHAIDGIMLLDMEGNVVSVNDSFARMHGYNVEEFLGMNLRELDNPETLALAEGRIARVMAGESLRFEVGHFHRDGHIVPLDVAVSAINIDDELFVLAFHRDITERKQAEELLASRKARLKAILDSAMEAIITVDESQHIVLFNSAAEAIFGYSVEEVNGTPLGRLIPERFRAAHAEHLKKFGASDGVPHRVDSRQRDVMGLRRNGEEFPFEASFSQISEDGAKLYTMVLRDITEQIKNENSLRSLQAELREYAVVAQSLRERERGRFARELHDELGQALTALKMDVRWIMERLPDGAEFLMSKLAGMDIILDGTMVSTRRMAGNLRPLILDDLGLIPATEWLVESFREHNGIDCRLEISDPCLDLQEPHATAVFRILQESLTNISKHAHASLVEISISQAGKKVKLAIRDNGRGFISTDPRKADSYGLTGLRERVHLLDGEMHIDSAPGRGTVIDVSIPNAQFGAEHQNSSV